MANEIEDYKNYYDIATNLVDIDTRNTLKVTTAHSTTAFTTVRITSGVMNYIPISLHFSHHSTQSTTNFWEIFGEEDQFKRFAKKGSVPDKAVTLERDKNYRYRCWKYPP